MKRAAIVIVVLALGALGGAGGYWYALKHQAMAPDAGAKAPAAGDRRVLYWYDPMYPQQRFDKPGKSPFMDMQLVPKYADEKAAEGGVTVSPHVAQNLGVRTAEARIGSLAPRLTAVGNVEYNERSFVGGSTCERRWTR
jgi:Cu(I)/Ag(I) efflux system membrane fusion protein